MTKKQLARFLKQIGSSINNLEKVPDVKLSDNDSLTAFKPKTSSNTTWYYTVIPGFSVEEFIIYLGLLQYGIEPQPFSSSPAIIQMPFTSYTSYTEQEVEEAIDSLKENGIIKPINPVIPDETRYGIADESLRRLIAAIWLVHIFDYHLLIGTLIHHKPSDKDKEHLGLYMDEVAANKVRIHAYDIRRSSKKEKQDKNNVKEVNNHIEKQRRLLIKEVKEKFSKVIQENEVVCELIEGVCFPSFISQSSIQN